MLISFLFFCVIFGLAALALCALLFVIVRGALRTRRDDRAMR